MKLLLAKLIEIKYIPDEYANQSTIEFKPVKYNQYQIFESHNIGDIVEDDTNYLFSESSYEIRKWKNI